jgi:hypothetical protein
VWRCGECASLLLQSASTRVHLALASEANPDPTVVAALAADADLMVAAIARWQQARLNSDGAGVSVPQVTASW